MAGVETQREEDGHISVAVPAAEVNAAPPLMEMQRQDEDGHTPPVVEVQRTYSRKMSLSYLRHLCHPLAKEMRGVPKELCEGKTYWHCLQTCGYFFFCHAFATIILNLTVCCRCYSSFLEPPESIKKRKGLTHKVVAFLAKILSGLWASTLIILFVRWMIFRPSLVMPHLTASTIYEFELQPSHQLRFNVTTAVLLHSHHIFYKIRHRHFAANLVYADAKLGPVDDDELPSFTQKPSENTLKQLSFVGQLRNASGTVVEETLVTERLEGLLHMVVRIRVLFSYGFFPFKGDYFTMFDCPLQSPIPHKDDPAFSSPVWCKPVD